MKHVIETAEVNEQWIRRIINTRALDNGIGFVIRLEFFFTILDELK